MKTSPFRNVLLALAVGSLSLTACEDPSNVGIGLVGEQGGRPVAAQAPVTGFAPIPLDRPDADIPPRVLAGSVDDPLTGTVTAAGYLDFASVSSSDFRSGTVQSAELRLLPTYVYGDTTAEITLAVRPVSDEFDSEGLPVDTSFTVGAVIREFTFRPTDSLVVVPMPDSWVATNDDVLRSTNFAGDFHGFRLDPVSGNAVVGFGPNSTVLHARTEEDSASFPVGRVYSALKKEEASLPAERVLVQAGTGPEARFTFNLDPNELEAEAINRIALTFWTDTLTVAEGATAGFVRPALTTLDLYGNTSDGAVALLARSRLDDRGRFIFDSEILAREIQKTILGTRTYESFEIRIPAPTQQNRSDLGLLSASINMALFFNSDAADKAPVAYLTLTPIDG